eukprot:8775269-Pyramimonas_sp.AAC.1
MDLALDRVLHPAVPARTEVLTVWAASRWDGVLSASMLDEVLLWASRNVTADTPWCDLHGPASAVVATLLRLGWSVATPTTWLTVSGMSVDITVVAPRDLSVLVARDAEAWAWKQATPQHPLLQHL